MFIILCNQFLRHAISNTKKRIERKPTGLIVYLSWISLKLWQMPKRWRISSFNGALPGRTSSLTWTPASLAAIASVYRENNAIELISV
jgi:hypothetical protein